MLLIKIIVFRITNVGVISVIRLLSTLKLGFIIWVTKYIIFDQSKDSLYGEVRAQNCSDLQIYSKVFSVSDANSANLRLYRICFLNNILFYISF